LQVQNKLTKFSVFSVFDRLHPATLCNHHRPSRPPCSGKPQAILCSVVDREKTKAESESRSKHGEMHTNNVHQARVYRPHQPLVCQPHRGFDIRTNATPLGAHGCWQCASDVARLRCDQWVTSFKELYKVSTVACPYLSGRKPLRCVNHGEPHQCPFISGQADDPLYT